MTLADNEVLYRLMARTPDDIYMGKLILYSTLQQNNRVLGPFGYENSGNLYEFSGNILGFYGYLEGFPIPPAIGVASIGIYSV